MNYVKTGQAGLASACGKCLCALVAGRLRDQQRLCALVEKLSRPSPFFKQNLTLLKKTKMILMPNKVGSMKKDWSNCEV